MMCPHCSHENAEGRKYCRRCGKPLAREAVPTFPASPTPPQVPSAGTIKPSLSNPSLSKPSLSKPALNRPSPSKPVLSKMAVASLILSFFSLILPFGIAAIVMGHTSRKRILQSGGRVSGRGISFAGLILGYIQLPVAVLFFVLVIGLAYQFNKELSRHPEDRAALVALIKNGGRTKATVPEDPAQREQAAIDALRLIRARQKDYLKAHPEAGYAGRTEDLGEPLNPENELGALIRRSQYTVRVQRTGGPMDPWYVALASPAQAFSPLPNYCLDSNGVIYQYSPERQNDVLTRVVAIEPQLCPQDGERVEQ